MIICKGFKGLSTGNGLCAFHNGHPTGGYCDLGVFGRSAYPDSCPHAPALHAVAENPELVLVAVEKCCGNCRHHFKGNMECTLVSREVGEPARFRSSWPACNKWEYK